MNTMHLCQLTDVPTRVTATSAKLLDYVIVQEGTEVESGIIPHNISDHDIVYCKLRVDLFNTSFSRIYDQKRIEEKVSYLSNKAESSMADGSDKNHDC
ncbi:uncharacterized protein isoform X2 [Leptinotarsa decemlineata]|uniref:uncharacterized protein isoform X2 n=1 Tax=Leptinotarsa decemlineata TaxID=7539 RepID=UPI003D309037